MFIEVTSKEDLRAKAAQVRQQANEELAQNSYNASWLHGYASALSDVADGLNVVGIYHMLDYQYVLEDALVALADFFDIDPYADADEQPGEYQLFLDTMGYSFDEACNDSSDHYILADLAYHFMKAKDCNIAVNDTWHSVVAAYVKDVKEKM